MSSANLNDNILFKVVKGVLKKPNRQERKKYFQKISHANSSAFIGTGMEEQIEDDLFISFRYEKDKKDLSIFIWTEDYSIGVTYDEFMAVYEAIKDKEKIINEIVASRV